MSVTELGEELVEVGRAIRYAVGRGPKYGDDVVVRDEGGDEVFGVDARADDVLVAELRKRCGDRWPGTAVVEGFAEAVVVGDASGPWRYIVDPVDGSRPWLAGKRSAWVLLGAGRDAATLADLEVSAVVELPTERARAAISGWATADLQLRLVDEDVDGESALTPRPRTGPRLDRTFVTVQRFAPGGKAAIAEWEDRVLAGLETYEDSYLCSGGQLMEVALGREAAVLDPRPLLVDGLAAHPYDLAGWLVARAAGVVVEALPPGPLHYPLDTTTPCAWAAYANEAIAAEIRARL